MIICVLLKKKRSFKYIYSIILYVIRNVSKLMIHIIKLINMQKHDEINSQVPYNIDISENL